MKLFFLACLGLIPLVFAGFITTKQAAKILDVDQRHISRLVKQGQLKGEKFGRDWMVDEESVNAYLQNRPKPGPNPVKNSDDDLSNPQ